MLGQQRALQLQPAAAAARAAAGLVGLGARRGEPDDESLYYGEGGGSGSGGGGGPGRGGQVSCWEAMDGWTHGHRKHYI